MFVGENSKISFIDCLTPRGSLVYTARSWGKASVDVAGLEGISSSESLQGRKEIDEAGV